MEQVMALLTLQGQLTLLMLVGIVLNKIGILDERGKRFLTDLVIDLVLPCNIIQSFRIKLDMGILQSTFLILLASVALQIGCSLIAATAYKGFSLGKRAVMQYGTLCSNAGFLGNVVAEGLFGSTGQLMTSIFLIPQRIAMWSEGVGYFMPTSEGLPSEEKKRHRAAVMKKTLTHPCIVAVAVGFVIMMLQIPLPAFLGNTVKSIGNCCTALSMILIGGIMGSSDFFHLLDRDVLLYCLIRLVLIPIGILLVCKLCGAPELITGVTVILSAMPMGGTTAILASKYGADAPFATKCIALSTILSLVTTPAWSLFL